MKSKTLRIGTRDSELALWQAKTVASMLQAMGYTIEIVAVKAQGDLVLDKPLYELGITGIFTKTLDVAMISGQIDIAVHSMKDVPTALPNGIIQAAVLERASVADILVHKGDLSFLEQEAVIATGSLRRRAQWLSRYPKHEVLDLRGNVNTRLQKLKDNEWDGAIFAAAGLERINLKPKEFINLDWMIPAPAQGAMMVVAMAEDTFALNALSEINHVETEICTYIERQFLRTLEGGCTAPIGALARYNEKTEAIDFEGVLLALDGSEVLEVRKSFALSEWKKIGYTAAKEILQNGGQELMTKIKTQLLPKK